MLVLCPSCGNRESRNQPPPQGPCTLVFWWYGPVNQFPNFLKLILTERAGKSMMYASKDSVMTHSEMLSVLSYSESTGLFTRLSTNRVTGKLNKEGYVEVQVGKKRYRAHRLAWFYVYGEWPPFSLDHADRVKTNNRISNLRYLTPSQQCQNTNLSPLNKSGCKGVSFDKKTGKWRARIRANNKKYSLGAYASVEEAARAYIGAARLVHTHNPLCDNMTPLST